MINVILGINRPPQCLADGNFIARLLYKDCY